MSMSIWLINLTDVESELDAFLEFTKRPLNSTDAQKWQQYQTTQDIPYSHKDASKVVQKYIAFYKSETKANPAKTTEVVESQAYQEDCDGLSELGSMHASGIGDIGRDFLSPDMFGRWVAIDTYAQGMMDLDGALQISNHPVARSDSTLPQFILPQKLQVQESEALTLMEMPDKEKGGSTITEAQNRSSETFEQQEREKLSSIRSRAGNSRESASHRDFNFDFEKWLVS
jgi:hypothetical protein